MSAPNLKEIEWAISELESHESTESRYTLLAALYICRSQMLGNTCPEPRIAAYSEAVAPEAEVLGQYGDSEFLRAAAGKDTVKVMAVIDDLMDALQVVNKRSYDNIIKKINQLDRY